MRTSNATGNASVHCISALHGRNGRYGLTKNRQAKRDDMTLSNAREIQAAIDINGETA